MRTLATQMTLRRLVRIHGEYVGRLASEPASTDLADAARARLLEMSAGIRQTWDRELGATAGGRDDQEFVRRHVRRSLTALDAAIATIRSPVRDPARLRDDLNEIAVPLGFFLRGLEVEGLAPVALSA